MFVEAELLSIDTIKLVKYYLIVMLYRVIFFIFILSNTLRSKRKTFIRSM